MYWSSSALWDTLLPNSLVVRTCSLGNKQRPKAGSPSSWSSIASATQEIISQSLSKFVSLGLKHIPNIILGALRIWLCPAVCPGKTRKELEQWRGHPSVKIHTRVCVCCCFLISCHWHEQNPLACGHPMLEGQPLAGHSSRDTWAPSPPVCSTLVSSPACAQGQTGFWNPAQCDPGRLCVIFIPANLKASLY